MDKKDILKLLKILIFLGPTIWLFTYLVDSTYHILVIPQDVDGEVVVNITDSRIEDNVNDLLKIPLKFLPREICLKNNNIVFSDNIEVKRSNEFPDVGDMNLYIEKNNKQVVDKMSVSVGEPDYCRIIDVTLLEGATITANYNQAGFIKLERRSDGSLNLVGGHETPNGFEVKITVDVSKTLLFVHLSFLSRTLLFIFSFLSISAVVLVIVELIKKIYRFINRDQFISGF